MTKNELIQTRDRQPFRAFKLHTADGASFLVEHPEFMWIVPNDNIVAVANPKGTGYEILDIALITRIEIPRRKQGAGA